MSERINTYENTYRLIAKVNMLHQQSIKETYPDPWGGEVILSDKKEFDSRFKDVEQELLQLVKGLEKTLDYVQKRTLIALLKEKNYENVPSDDQD